MTDLCCWKEKSEISSENQIETNQNAIWTIQEEKNWRTNKNDNVTPTIQQ